MSTEQLGPIQEVLGAWQEQVREGVSTTFERLFKQVGTHKLTHTHKITKQARLTQQELTRVTQHLEESRSEKDALLAKNERVSKILSSRLHCSNNSC